MPGYTKLFSSIVTSTVWCEDNATLRVWIAMLAMSDARGKVEGSVPGFAHLARVTVEEMRHALTVLTAPDPDSRTPDNEGRRIDAVSGGWLILNYTAYRESRDPDIRREQNREAQRRHRSSMSSSVSQESAQAEAEAKAEAGPLGLAVDSRTLERRVGADKISAPAPGEIPAKKAPRTQWAAYVTHFIDRIKSAKGLDRYDFTPKQRGILAALYDQLTPQAVMALWDLFWMRGQPWSDYAVSRGHSMEAFAADSMIHQLLDAQKFKEWRDAHARRMGVDATSILDAQA